MKTFRVIKSTPFTTSDGRDGTTYVLGYKGHVLTTSTLAFDEPNDLVFDEEAGTLTVNCNVYLRKEEYQVDEFGNALSSEDIASGATGLKKTGYRLMPTLDLVVM